MSKPWIKILLLFIVTILLLELGLRLAGYRPGYFFTKSFYEKTRFKPVDSLEYLKVFYPDSDGITKINQDFCKTFSSSNSPVNTRYFDYICGAHLNSDGYRNREFTDTANKGKKKVKLFLLGDSFTYGFSAKPITLSFADLLDNDPDFEVYNGGVPGSDPVTYLAIAKKYLQQVRPDFVIVNFFLYNDEVYYPKKLVPYKFNDIFVTNAGGLVRLNFESLDRDSVEIFEGPLDAYKNVHMKSSLLFAENKWAKLATHSCITTLAWRFLNLDQNVKINVVKYKKENYTPYLLNAIKEEAEKVNAKFILSFIPTRDGKDVKELQLHLDTITNKQIPYNLINTLHPDDYAPSPDSHFNNSGHAKYAEFLKGIIQKK